MFFSKFAKYEHSKSAGAGEFTTTNGNGRNGFVRGKNILSHKKNVYLSFLIFYMLAFFILLWARLQTTVFSTVVTCIIVKNSKSIN